jgi:uroporphyrinogen decarboxylase
MLRHEIGPTDQRVEKLLLETRANSGLAPVDLDQFWADQLEAGRDPFSPSIPQVPMGIDMAGECVFAELGVEEDLQRYYSEDEAWRLDLHRAYNDRAEKIIGRRLFTESPSDPARQYVGIKGLHDVFEAENVRRSGSDWLLPSAGGEDELRGLLDRVERRDLRSFILPDNWDEQKTRLTASGVPVPLYRYQRGPVTFATSIYGVENLVFLIHDNPGLAVRFREAILNTMLGIARLLDEEAGYTPETAPHGFSFYDDNCYLLTPEMYELFGYPILEGIFERYSPGPGDSRYQHSDSDMAHLLPVLGDLHFTEVNFGPTLTVSQIRRYLPGAVIQGQLAPFTFSRNEEEQIVAEFLRDLEMAREERGLRFATAGSVNNGSRLTGLRLIMAAIQRYGRYPYS